MNRRNSLIRLCLTASIAVLLLLSQRVIICDFETSTLALTSIHPIVTASGSTTPSPSGSESSTAGATQSPRSRFSQRRSSNANGCNKCLNSMFACSCSKSTRATATRDSLVRRRSSHQSTAAASGLPRSSSSATRRGGSGVARETSRESSTHSNLRSAGSDSSSVRDALTRLDLSLESDLQRRVAHLRSSSERVSMTLDAQSSQQSRPTLAQIGMGPDEPVQRRRREFDEVSAHSAQSIHTSGASTPSSTQGSNRGITLPGSRSSGDSNRDKSSQAKDQASSSRPPKGKGKKDDSSHGSSASSNSLDDEEITDSDSIQEDLDSIDSDTASLDALPPPTRFGSDATLRCSNCLPLLTERLSIAANPRHSRRIAPDERSVQRSQLHRARSILETNGGAAAAVPAPAPVASRHHQQQTSAAAVTHSRVRSPRLVSSHHPAGTVAAAISGSAAQAQAQAQAQEAPANRHRKPHEPMAAAAEAHSAKVKGKPAAGSTSAAALPVTAVRLTRRFSAYKSDLH